MKAELLASVKLSKWSALLKLCFLSYERGECLIAVPSLLLILEGTLADLGNIAFENSKERAKYFEQKISESEPESVNQYRWRSMNSFITTLFGFQSFKGPRPDILNRHWILHGRDVPDWDESDCLRLLEAIRTVTHLQL